MIFVRVCIMCLSVSSRSSSFIETDKRIGLVFGMEASFHLTLYCNEILVSPKYRYFPLELSIGGLPKNFAMARRPSLSQAATCLQLHSRKLDALLSVIKSTATTSGVFRGEGHWAMPPPFGLNTKIFGTH